MLRVDLIVNKEKLEIKSVFEPQFYLEWQNIFSSFLTPRYSIKRCRNVKFDTVGRVLVPGCCWAKVWLTLSSSVLDYILERVNTNQAEQYLLITIALLDICYYNIPVIILTQISHNSWARQRVVCGQSPARKDRSKPDVRYVNKPLGGLTDAVQLKIN